MTLEEGAIVDTTQFIAFEAKTTFMATRTMYVHQLVEGEWQKIATIRGSLSSGKWFASTNEYKLAPNATGLRFEYSGTGLGSLYVRNVEVFQLCAEEKTPTSLVETKRIVARKLIRNGQMVILRDGEIYDLSGCKL